MEWKKRCSLLLSTFINQSINEKRENSYLLTLIGVPTVSQTPQLIGATIINTKHALTTRYHGKLIRNLESVKRRKHAAQSDLHSLCMLGIGIQDDTTLLLPNHVDVALRSMCTPASLPTTKRAPISTYTDATDAQRRVAVPSVPVVTSPPPNFYHALKRSPVAYTHTYSYH